MKNLIILLLSLFILNSCNLQQKSAEEYYTIANTKLKAYDYAGAIENLSYAIKINPEYAEAYFKRGIAYLEGKYLWIYYWGYNFNFNELTFKEPRAVLAEEYYPELKNALDDISKAIELNPKYIEAYKLRAAIKIYKGNNIDAFEDYNEIIKINPNDDECFSMRAKLKSDFGDNKSAIEDYRKAILINPKKYLYYLRIGFNYNILNNLQEEIASYEKAYEIDTTKAYILVYIADAKAKMQDFNSAIFYYTKYIESKYLDEKEQKKSDILISRGKAKIRAGLVDSGLDDFSKAGSLGNQEGYKALADYKGE